MRISHLNNAGHQLAEYLSQHKHVGKVYYTGLTEHPQHDLAQRYLKGHGGVVTFEIKGDKDCVSEFVDTVKIPFMGTNFGSSYSMIEQLSIFTYFNQSEKERKDLGITDNLVRYSIGFDDNIEDIIYDIDSSLNKIFKNKC